MVSSDDLPWTFKDFMMTADTAGVVVLHKHMYLKHIEMMSENTSSDDILSSKNEACMDVL